MAPTETEEPCLKSETSEGFGNQAGVCSRKTPRLQYLDALRGWAIAGVMLVHSAQIVDLPAHWIRYVREGARGVELFYLVSAFTLCYVTRCVHEREPWWPNFFLRRFFRIAPMYYVTVAAAALVYALGSSGGMWHKLIALHVYWSGGAESPTAGCVVANLLFLHGFNPYWITSLVPGGWSVAVEVVFYALFPLLFRLGATPLRALLLVIGSTLLAAILPRFVVDLNVIQSRDLWGHYLYFWFPNQLPVFCLGILLFHLAQWIEQRSDRARIRLSVLFTVAGCFGLALLLFMGRVNVVPWHVLVAIGFFTIIAGLIAYPLPIFVNSPLIKLGRISYSCYLCHMFAVSLTDYANRMVYEPLHDLPPLLSLVAAYASVVAITCLVSWTTWTYVEEKGISFGKALIGKFGGKKPETRATVVET